MTTQYVKREYLDMCKGPYHSEKIYRARTREVAIRHAKRFGWPTKSLCLACTHIESFWIVCQTNMDITTFLNWDGTWTELPYPGYIKK